MKSKQFLKEAEPMATNVATAYDRLNSEYRLLVDDFINMLFQRQEKQSETVRVLRDAQNGIGISEPYHLVEELMEALNADD